ncbi:hypothetical protein ACROYT_G032118 [Oculina patagonica]
MEEGYKKVIERHRDKFRRAVTVERLFSPLVVSHVVNSEEAQAIQGEHPAQRVDRLLDVIQRKDYETFKKFCVVLETTYPYMLNCMFLGVEPPTTSVSAHIRTDQGKTADNDEDTATRHMQCIGSSRRVNVGRSTSMTGHDLCKDRLIVLKNELRTVKRDLEKVTNQLHETERERDAYKKINDLKNADRIHMDNNSNLPQGSDRDNEFDILKKQYVDCLKELEMLRYENSDISAKYESVCQQCENSRKYKMLFQSLQRRFDEINLERDKLKQEYEEIVLLREREKIELIEMKDNQKYEEFVKSHSANTALDKYESHKKEYESLQDTHRDLRSKYNHLFNSYQNLESDYSALKIQFDGLLHEQDALIVERNGLKQQAEAAISKYEKAINDRDSVLKVSYQVQQDREREREQVMSRQFRTAKDITKLTEERNAALNEYQLVMSERDTVHREIEKLQDELTDLRKTNENLQNDYSKLQNHIDDTQGELSLLVEEREQASKEVFGVKEQLSQTLLEKENVIKELDKTREDYEMLKQERNVARRERSEAIIHRDKILKECFEIRQKHQLVIKGEHKEMDALRKEFEVLSKELTNALHDIEVVKVRRDWAMTERDKVIQDRDSLKIRFDKMQHERDRAVSDLAELLHESDDIRRKHNEAVGELLELRSHIENQLNQGSLSQEHLSSRDSAIDTDSNEWETESIVLERMNLDDDLGIAIAGGRDTPAIPNDSSIVITNVAKGSIADGKLKVNDCVLKVNNIDLTNVEYRTAVQAISRGEVVNMTVKRKRLTGSRPLLYPVSLILTNNKELGIRVDSTNHISSIVPGSVAAEEETIAVGDKIVTINGTSVENLSQTEVERLLSTSLVRLTLQKLSASSSRTQVLQSLLDEVNEKINRENDICREVEHTKERITNSGSLYELQLSQQESSSAYYSGKSSPLPDDQISSTPESISEPVLHSSSSLTPLYEENRERLREKQTDSSDLSTEEGSASHLVTSGGSSSRGRTFVKLRKSLMRPSPLTQSPNLSMPVQKERPMPPARTCSYMSAITSPPQPEADGSSQEDNMHTMQSASVSSAHFPSNSFPDSSVVNTSNTVVIPRKKNDSYFRNGSRPQSAPSARNYQVPLGGSPAASSFGRYSSHEDPLALTPPKPNMSGPPVTVAVLRSANVPYYTAKSHSVQNYGGQPAVSQQCLPVQCRNKHKHDTVKLVPPRGRHSRQGSSHSADGDDHKVRHLSLYNYDPPSNSKNKGHRISLPTPPSQLTSYPSGSYRSSSVSSTYSISSGHTTPVVVPSTPIVPATEEGGPALAFDFSGPLASKEDPLNRDYEPRLVHIEKKDTLGISIAAGCQGGVFVCSVNEGSVAAKAGLKYGDQLLEYNGVNLRCATYEQAAMILKQSGNSVTILAQFNPEKVKETTESLSSQSEASTACSTPVNKTKHSHEGSSSTPPIRRNGGILPIIDNEPPGDLRYVFFTKSPSSLGFNIAGGNAMGIFVSEIQPDDEGVSSSGLSVGDHILELNGVDLTSVTAEQAMLELCKPTETVQILAQYNPTKFNSLRDQPGDSFYVRALFERATNTKEELNFKKGDILYVTDTMFNGHMGCWRACLVNEEDAQKREIGMVPSRMKAEQEILLRRSLALAHGDEYKLSGRRSFFRRSKKGTHGMSVNHSREGSDSATSITTSCTDLGIASYQTVEKLDSHIPRAVILFGPMVDVLYEKLCEEVPYKFVQCKPEVVDLPKEKVEKGIADGTFVDYAWKGQKLSVTKMASIKQVTDKHCLLDVSSSAVERLHALQVYPIILFVKFKSPKHIRDQKDSQYIREKMSLRIAKELYESSAKMERELKHLFSGTCVVHGSSVSSICSQIQEMVDEQQKRTVWVPLSSV